MTIRSFTLRDLPSAATHFIKVLFIILFAEVLTLPIMLHLTETGSPYLSFYHVVEPLTIPLAAALFIWYSVVRPLRRIAIRELGERDEVMKALAASEARSRQIFEQTDNALFIFDGDLQRTLDLNPAAELLFEHDREQLVRKPPLFFLAPEECERIRWQQREVGGSELFRMDKMRLTIGGERWLHLSVHGRRIELGGEPAILCAINDITEKVVMEEQARDIQAKLIQANKMTSLGVLVNGIAHDINNPNNYILVSSELLNSAWKDMRAILAEHHERHGDFTLAGIPFATMQHDIQGLLESITEGSNRIRDIVNTLKDFAREGKGAIRGDVDLNQLVRQVTTIISHQIMRHTRHFTLETAPGLPLVSGNPQQLEQVVINLVLNAIQALPSPERGMRVSTCFDSQAGTVCIEVADEGEGISAEIADKVMEPFFTTRLDSGGTGLGLPISQAIVRDHKGSLSFTSVPGQGTKFLVQLPTLSMPSRGDQP